MCFYNFIYFSRLYKYINRAAFGEASGIVKDAKFEEILGYLMLSLIANVE